MRLSADPICGQGRWILWVLLCGPIILGELAFGGSPLPEENQEPERKVLASEHLLDPYFGELRARQVPVLYTYCQRVDEQEVLVLPLGAILNDQDRAYSSPDGPISGMLFQKRPSGAIVDRTEVFVSPSGSLVAGETHGGPAYREFREKVLAKLAGREFRFLPSSQLDRLLQLEPGRPCFE